MSVFALSQRTLIEGVRGQMPNGLRIISCLIIGVALFIAFTSRAGAPGLDLFSWVIVANTIALSLIGILLLEYSQSWPLRTAPPVQYQFCFDSSEPASCQCFGRFELRATPIQ